MIFDHRTTLNQSCYRLLLPLDQSNIEITQFSIPPFVCLVVRRFGNVAIVVCTVSNFFENRLSPVSGCIPWTAATGGAPSARAGSSASLSLICLF